MQLGRVRGSVRSHNVCPRRMCTKSHFYPGHSSHRILLQLHSPGRDLPKQVHLPQKTASGEAHTMHLQRTTLQQWISLCVGTPNCAGCPWSLHVQIFKMEQQEITPKTANFADNHQSCGLKYVQFASLDRPVIHQYAGRSSTSVFPSPRPDTLSVNHSNAI